MKSWAGGLGLRADAWKLRHRYRRNVFGFFEITLYLLQDGCTMISRSRALPSELSEGKSTCFQRLAGEMFVCIFVCVFFPSLARSSLTLDRVCLPEHR